MQFPSNAVQVVIIAALAIIFCAAWVRHQHQLFFQIFGFKPTRSEYSFRAERIKKVELKLNELRDACATSELSASRCRFEEALNLANFCGYLPDTFRDELREMQQKPVFISAGVTG